MQRLLWLVCAALAAARAAVVAPVTPHGPPNTPAVVTSAAYLSTETDVLDTPGWMRALFGVHFDEEERRCAAKDEVLYRPLHQCFVLFRRGPCARKEWLVFDKQKAARGVLTVVCAPRRCAPDWGYDAASGTCFRHTKCVSPLAFHYTLFGEGVCRCNGTTGGLVNAPPDDPASCHELYRHVPCRKGQMLAPRYRLIEGMDAMCFRDPCDGYKPPPTGNASAPVTTTTTANPTVTAATTPAPFVKGRPTHGDRGPHDHHDHRGGHPFGWRGTPEPDVRPVWRMLPKGEAPPAHAHGRPSPDPARDGSGGEEDFDVELIGGPSRPNLGVRTSTSAVLGSSSSNNKQSTLSHDHEHWDHSGWPDPEHGDDFRGHDQEQGHFHAQESAPVQRKHALNFTIMLKPLPQDGATRTRRQLPPVWPESRTARNARGEPNSRVSSATGGHKHNPRGAPNAEPDSATRGNRFDGEAAARYLQGNSGAANVTDDYALEVQYSDGNRSCMSPSQLNVVCDLQMVPLFSDFGDVKVPICVNALFRFAIGRVGKSDECAENDKGECAKKVVVKSAEPLDWELE